VAIDESINAASSNRSHFWQSKNPSPNAGFMDGDGDINPHAADAVSVLRLFFALQ
jgi:hypothetical protein